MSTTGRAYRVAPTVSVAAPHVDYNGTQAVGIATIHPITGIVTAVGFNSTTDAWAVGTAATVGLGYTVSQLTLSFSGSTAQERATGTTTIDGDGQVISVSIGNSGYGYVTAPTVTIDGPGGAQEDFRALGVATMRYNSITEIVTVGAASTEITGVTTNAILVGDRVRQTYGWDSEELNVRFIGTDAYVSHIGMGVIYMSEASTNVGVATTSIEFGIPNCGIVTGIAVTFGGGGYLTPPEVSIANTIGNSNYHEEVAGITTATGVAILNEAGTVISIGISESGFGYIIGTGSTEPIITVGAPSTSSIGNYLFNEQVSGSISGAEARVRSWNATTNILEISSVSGTFIHGDTILGQTSGASHALRVVDLEPTDDGFADNLNIEIAADEILDFTEQNPFGTP